MARTFLFTWIFTLPWVLVDEVRKLPALIMVVFFITYGEQACMITHPFSSDA